MEGIIAVVGFWVCMIAIVVRKPVMAFIEKSKGQRSNDVHALTERVVQLEGAVATIGKEVQEAKDTTEFAHKLLIDSAQHIADAHKLLIENAQQQRQSGNAKPLLASTMTASDNAVKLLTHTPTTPLVADFGRIINEHTVRFERLLPASVEKVWQYLTGSERLAQWLAAGFVEPRVGGRVELNFDLEEVPERKEKGARIRGLISCFEPLRALAFSWIDTGNNLESTVAFELSAQGDQTSVVVTHSRLPKDRMHEFMAGWHTHLDVLKARLTGVAPPAFGKRFNEVVQTYAVVVAASVVVSGGPALAAPSAEAYQTIQTERSHLLSRYDSLWRDADDLRHQISVLKRDTSPEAERTADRLDRVLQDDYHDLHQVELDIRDLDSALK